jgi:hypothetical protein
MKGFPQIIATPNDFENLLNTPEFQDQALMKLQELQDHDDRTVTRATTPIDPEDPESDFNTEEIENPSPLHRQRGFSEWMDIVRLNAETQGVRVSEITGEYSEEQIESAVVELT